MSKKYGMWKRGEFRLNSDVHYPESGRFNFILDGCGPWGWGWVQKIEILCVRH